MEKQAVEIISQIWDWLAWLINSNFVAALAGAFAGAYAANRIAIKKERHTDLKNRIRDTNSAITVAALVSNKALALKGQYVLDLHKDFTHDLATFNEARDRHERNDPDAPERIDFVFGLSELPTLHSPTETLFTLVFDKVRIDGRPLGLMLAIQEAHESLNLSINTRNQLCREFRPLTEQERIARYFGAPSRDGIDEKYPDSVFNIYQSANDLAFFSATLCADLQKHGKELVKAYEKEIGKPAPQINEAKFDTPRALDLMPPEAAYSDFLNMFQTKK